MPITEKQLVAILPLSKNVAAGFAPALTAAMARYDITTLNRAAAFIAQIGHESGQLNRVIENLNYSAKGLLSTWPKRFDQKLAASVERKPEMIAAIVYDGRNGNNQPGDGFKYRGRGLLQITGKENYRACGVGLGLDLLTLPGLLERSDNAALSAAWWWSNHGLNTKADRGDFKGITQTINGGQNGAAEREQFYARALEVLKQAGFVNQALRP